MKTAQDWSEPYSIRVPEKVAVFPLPNVLLFPGVELPLYIFEPRYRKMLADCASGSKFMALSLFKAGWEHRPEPIPSHDVVGVGFVRAIFENPDGSSHILLKGVGRARIERYVRKLPYRVAKIAPLHDEVEDGGELSELARQLKRLLLQKLRLTSEHPDHRPRFPREFANPILLSHVACFLAKVNPYRKQHLLEITQTNSRIRQLIGILEEEICPSNLRN